MTGKPSLKDILLEDTKNAKVPEGPAQDVLPPGDYRAKVISFTEEDAYQYMVLEINKKKYNFFYRYYIKDTTDLDANTINFIKALATIPTTDKTTLLEIANSAIGSTYKVTIYNYVGKSGKNAGKQQHALRFSVLPVLDNSIIEEETVEIPDLPI